MENYFPELFFSYHLLKYTEWQRKYLHFNAQSFTQVLSNKIGEGVN